MPNNQKHTFFLSFCGIVIFVLGATAGIFFSEKISGEKIDIPEIEPQVKVVTRIEHQEAIPVDDTEQQALRDRIAELEAQLAEQQEMPRRGMRGRGGPGDRPDPPDHQQRGNDEPRPPRMNYQERMEKLKAEDPERYAAIQQHMTEMKERMKAERDSRKEFFASVDTTRMSADQKTTHTELMNAIALVDSYQERMSPDSEQPLTSEERREFWDTTRKMRELMNDERRYILSELGSDCGMDGNEFADYIDAVYNQTGGRGPGFGPGRRQPPPPPPPPGN